MKKLTGQKLKEWVDRIHDTNIYMEIPKFKIEQSFKLNDALINIGVKTAFNSDNADFSGMIEPSQAKLVISDVLHKAFIQTDEKGTEAAAATLVKYAIVCSSMGQPRVPKRFIADHPFLFLLTAGKRGDKTIMSAQIGNFEFALKLASQLTSKCEETNVFLSPASISIVMTMCYSGAKGQTKKEMKESMFGAKATDDDIKRWIQNVLTLGSADTKDFTLKFANRLYSSQRFQFKRDYVRSMINEFKSDALTADFAKDSERITDEINEWVEQVTNSKIRKLVPRGTLDVSTALALINALYFKGAWSDQFKQSSTQKKKFFVKQNETIDVDMMNNKEEKLWFENEDAQILELGYNDTSASMVLILPKQKNCLQKLVNSLNGEKLKQWMDGMRSEDVYMEIPKFKIEQSFDLNETLKSVGIKKAFEDADFSAMIDADPDVKFKISKVLHKAFIEVDEKGTEAAAATLVKVSYCCMSFSPDKKEPKRFIADHPFLFMLTAGSGDDRTILFLGRYHGTDASS